MKDDVFGDLSFEYGWIGQYPILFFGQPIDLKLVIPCDEDDEIELEQRQAFLQFDKNKDKLLALIEEQVFTYYWEVCGEYRERFGTEFADKKAPIITKKEEVSKLVFPTELIVQQSFGNEDRTIGFLMDCRWDPERGLAVKFEDGQLVAIGPQDIVL